MKLKHILLEELDLKGKKAIAASIYQYTFKNSTCSISDPQCHEMVDTVKRGLKEFWWYRDIKFYQWDERKWKSVAKKLEFNTKKFGNNQIDNLIEDIIDGSVNGHSFLSFQGYWIDPFLKAKGVSESKIQVFCQYFSSLIK